MSRKILTGAFIALAIVSCKNERIEEEYNITPNMPTRSSTSLEFRKIGGTVPMSTFSNNYRNHHESIKFSQTFGQFKE